MPTKLSARSTRKPLSFGLPSLCILTANGIPSVRRKELGNILTVYTGRMSHLNLASGVACHESPVAQWQSIRLENRRLWVRIPLGYHLFLGNEFNIDRSF